MKQKSGDVGEDQFFGQIFLFLVMWTEKGRELQNLPKKWQLGKQYKGTWSHEHFKKKLFSYTNCFTIKTVTYKKELILKQRYDIM